MKGMYNKLPRYVKLRNEKFIINTDYRIFVEFEKEMQDSDQYKAIMKVFKRFYPAFFKIIEENLIQEAIDKFLWFYRCGKNDCKQLQTTANKNQNRVFDYEEDDLYIWGAFKMYFNIDLSTAKLHWWKFKALWKTIPDSAEFSKIKGYRAYNGKDENLLKLKEHYKLPPTRQEIEDNLRRNKIYEQLMKGG